MDRCYFRRLVVKTKEAKGSALKEGLKKYVGNLTGGRVREAKKAREGFKKRTAKNLSLIHI